jgi:hypothetical protein
VTVESGLLLCACDEPGAESERDPVKDARFRNGVPDLTYDTGVATERESRAQKQREVVAGLETRLREKGFDAALVELMVLAHRTKGTIAGLKKQRSRLHHRRIERLRRLLALETSNHPKLHDLLCERRRVLPRRGLGHAARPIQWVTWGGPQCNLSDCDEGNPGVRRHAEFCLWLARQVERAQAEAKAEEEREIDSWLEDGERDLVNSKGALVVILRNVVGAELRDAAIFVLVRVDGLDPPIGENVIASAEHRLSVALSAWGAETGVPVVRRKTKPAHR